VGFFTGRQTHLVSSSHEQVEAEQCVQLSLRNTDSHQLEFHPKPTIVGSQGSADFVSLTGILAHAAGSSGWFDPKALFQSLLTQLGDVVCLPETAQVSFDPHGVKLTDVDGQTFRTEMAIVANHLQMRELIPGLGPALIKLADQWDEFSVEKSFHDALQPGHSFSMNYGQTWGVVTSTKTIRMGGSRFLRPMAGVDANTAAVHPKLTQYHQRLCQNILAVWPSLQSSADALSHRRVNESQLSHARSQGYFDILPCDETPVIGPMFGEPRLLCGTGYYGYGFPLAVQAGAWLAEIVAVGQAEGLPKEFWPHRLRHLGEP
jgi:glycine/D-amino acid oxidase-like deaminating enzyme